MSIGLLVLGIVLFIGLIVVHEWGHFLAARRGGVEVEEFGVFFPPRLYNHKTKKGWRFTFNLIPLGGFVKLKGEHDTDTAPASFGASSTWVKTKIMAAGVFMNLVVGLILLTIVALVGMPQLVPNQFAIKSDAKTVKNEVLATTVMAGSPAQKAGLKDDDQLLQIGTAGRLHTIASVNDLLSLTKKYAGQTVTVVFADQGRIHSVAVELNSLSAVAASQKTNNPKGYLGVYDPTSFTLKRSTWSAPVVAIGLTAQLTALTYQGLAHAVSGLGSIIAGSVTGNAKARSNGQTAASSQVAGPVGIFAIMKTGSILGYQFMLMIIAVISLTLALMNILPIPALDGGRLWLTLFTHAIKKPLPAKREELINAVGFVVLASLIVLITIVDVHRFY